MTDEPREVESVLTAGENRVKRWVLLTGGRITVMVALMVGVFAFIVALSLVRPVEMHELLNETNAAKQLFTALLSGAILLVSVVVSINSVVLSKEITDLDSQQARVDTSIEYHRSIEEFIEADVTPARPAEFLIAVLYGISTRVEELRSIASGSANEEFRSDVQQLSEQITEDIQHTRWTLEHTEKGSFDVLLAGLDYDYSGQLHAIRSLKRKHGDDLADEEREAIDAVLRTLKHVGTSREYFKSLYFKRELAHLSSRLLYVALPVIVFTSYVILALDEQLFPDVSMYGLSSILLSVAFAYAIALAPYLILTSYIVRATTVALRTLSAGPFILRTGPNVDSVDWEVSDPDRDWGSVGGEESLSEELEED